MANKIKNGNQADFSSNQGYLVPKFNDRGIAQSTTDAVTYKDASRYMENQTADILSAGVTDIRDTFQATQAIGPAKFSEFGSVRLDDPNNQIPDPRIIAFNSGRGFTITKAFGNTDTVSTVSCLSGAPALSGSGTSSDGTDSDGLGRIVATTVAAPSDLTMLTMSPNTSIGKRQQFPYLYMKFKLRDASGYRLWISIADGNLRGSDTNAANNYIGLRYSSGAGDSTFHLFTADGANASGVDTGVTASIATLYEIELWETASTAFCRINNGAIISKSSNLSTSTTVRTNIGAEIRSTTAGTEYGFRFYGASYSQR